MRPGVLLTTSLLLWLFVHLLLPSRAYAYLDPGSGSYLLQIAIASLLGGILALRLFWNRIKTFWVDLLGRRERGEEREADNQRE